MLYGSVNLKDTCVTVKLVSYVKGFLADGQVAR